MNVLIVVSDRSLGEVWSAHLQRQGAAARLAMSQDEAIVGMQLQEPDVVILDLMLQDGAAFAVSDYVSYRFPHKNIIFVSGRRFFSDGSIFQHCPNACAYVPRGTKPEDLAALAEHHATH